jgi:hypothetical protein
VLVPVSGVGRVTVAIVDVVDMIVVGNGLVPTIGTVSVRMLRVGDMLQRVLVIVVTVGAMSMTIVDVVGMPLMLDCGVPARRSVLVGVALMHGVFGNAHCSSLL